VYAAIPARYRLSLAPPLTRGLVEGGRLPDEDAGLIRVDQRDVTMRPALTGVASTM
jgi:hypothetical protein